MTSAIQLELEVELAGPSASVTSGGKSKKLNFKLTLNCTFKGGPVEHVGGLSRSRYVTVTT